MFLVRLALPLFSFPFSLGIALKLGQVFKSDIYHGKVRYQPSRLTVLMKVAVAEKLAPLIDQNQISIEGMMTSSNLTGNTDRYGQLGM